MPPSPWRELLLDPSGKHLVLVHETDPYLHTCVATWAARPLTTGGGAVLVGRRAYLTDILRQIWLLGVDVDDRIASGRLVVLDAEDTLASLLIAGEPDRALFHEMIRSTIARVERACGQADADIRVWGEMVSLLHEAGRVPTAKSLESLWDEFLAQERVRLLCTYKLDAIVDIADACETHATLLYESRDIESAAARVLTQMFGEPARGTPLQHLVRRGGVPIGGPPASALLLPLARWRRPVGMTG